MKFEFSAGAFVYLIEDDKILMLLLRREKDYDIPKGHIEKGETALEAAKREVKEETGLEPEFLPFFSVTTKYFFYEGKEKVMKHVKFFIAKSNTKNVTISFEHKGYEWLTYAEFASKVTYKDLREILPEVYDYIKRNVLMEALNERYANLPEKSKGWQLSKNFVPGEGPLNARIMLVGQAPGRNEDVQRRPFVGRAGQLLDRLLRSAKIKREEVYITSVVQFYPPENRPPTSGEVALCLPFLKEQIEIIKPKLIVLLGNIASEALLGISNISQAHGKLIEREDVSYFITFHPAAALRFPDIARQLEEDFKLLAEYAGKIIGKNK